MPRNKDLKRVVRSRMAKTGESYTAARAHVVAKKGRRAVAPGAVVEREEKVVASTAAPPEGVSGAVEPTAAAAPAEKARPAARPRKAATGKDPARRATKAGKPDYAALAGMSDEAVERNTGCSWRAWVGHLDYRGAAQLPHREIVALVKEQLGGNPWWCQAVAVGYERIRGLREIGQRRDGAFEANKSRTFAVPRERLWDAFQDEALRRRWLPQAKVKRVTPPKSLRPEWEDGTPVQVWIEPRGAGKHVVAVGHGKLPSRERAEELKVEWGARFDALAELLG